MCVARLIIFHNSVTAASSVVPIRKSERDRQRLGTASVDYTSASPNYLILLSSLVIELRAMVRFPSFYFLVVVVVAAVTAVGFLTLVSAAEEQLRKYTHLRVCDRQS